MTDFEGYTDNPTMESLAAIAGEEALARLSYDFAAKRLYIPKMVTEGHPLSVSIGFESAQKICEIYGGVYFTVPVSMGKKLHVKRLKSEGLSVPAIARRLLCSHSYVKKVLAEDGDKNQMNLF